MSLADRLGGRALRKRRDRMSEEHCSETRRAHGVRDPGPETPHGEGSDWITAFSGTTEEGLERRKKKTLAAPVRERPGLAKASLPRAALG